ncbi:nicotinate phosphoribosyltransferase [Adhaeribacter soli]|uniref:Nicotinate phosphoribosyltransferase n=1 Tax=Adhaeribacter soli TaxID=2607655 RepID=A0A5N1J3Z0_9BACT|nr:nicotinate phosphoribosyltransferase [Adhaeribacter soli]KAA9340574.1 nicotinate phosphoribosyltransferase [Adhaeribacter soli]
MNFTRDLYGTSLSLLTDLYQLTMAYGYWKSGLAEKEAVFHLYFRKNPFEGGYAVCAGLEYAVQYLQSLQFSEDDLAYLSSLKSATGQELFETGFINYLRQLKFTCDVDAIPEGTVVFPNEPLIRVTGPLLQAQLVETPLLTLINFQTLIATKAARITEAAQGDLVMEFGMRRAQGVDGALAAARAVFIGGAKATSNVLAGKLFGFPVKGTHAHSWVMAFEEEEEAFEKYAEAFPNDSVFLVDTYDTLEGVKNAIKVAQKLRTKGSELAGIRLDSGDLTYLSREARKLLDEAGFPNVSIVASNDLDEYLIADLKKQGARIDTWGIGTRLVTAYDQPALGGVYKMGALRDEKGNWQYKLKLSEQLAKTSTPGVLQVRRFISEENKFVADMICNEAEPLPEQALIIDPFDFTHRKAIPAGTRHEDLLMPVFRGGEQVYKLPSLPEIQARTQQQLRQLDPSSRRFLNPHVYPVGLEETLFEMKTNLVLSYRKTEAASS